MSAMDKMMIRGFELMMSNDPDSTEQLRELLYDSLVQKYGAGVKPPPMPEDCYPEAASSGTSHRLAISEGHMSDSADSTSSYQSPLLPLSDDSSQASADVVDNSNVNFTELSCIICGLFSVGVCNQLMECNSCQNLYHQDCHDPPVKAVARSHWECSDCLTTKQSQVKSSLEEKLPPSNSPSGLSPSKSDLKSLHKSSSSGSSSHKSSTKTSSGGHSSSSSHHAHHNHRSHHSRHGHSHSSGSSSSSKRHSASSSSLHKSSSHHHHHKSSSSRESKQSD